MGHHHTDGADGQPPEPAWSVPGQHRMNPFPPGSYVVEEAHSLFGEFVAAASDLDAADQLVAMRQVIDQLEGLWLAAAADFSESGALAETGHRSLASWMRHHCHLAPGEAASRSRVAFAVTESQPATGKALRDGSLSWRHAQVIGGALRQVPAELREEAELALVAEAGPLDPGQLRQVADRLVHCMDRKSADDIAIRRLDRRGLSVAETIDGMVAVSGLLDPVNGALLLTALNSEVRSPQRGATDHGDGHEVPGLADVQRSDSRSWPQRRADALGEICSAWLSTINDAVVGGVRPHLSVIVDHATLATRPEPPLESAQDRIASAHLQWVGPITASEAQMIGCDSTVSRIVMDGASQVIDVGRVTRTIPPALRRAVSARDRMCVGPGCHRPPEQCDVHHIIFWEHGGETSQANTVLLCRHHHRLVHLKQWRVVVESDGTRRLMPP